MWTVELERRRRRRLAPRSLRLSVRSYCRAHTAVANAGGDGGAGARANDGRGRGRALLRNGISLVGVGPTYREACPMITQVTALLQNF